MPTNYDDYDDGHSHDSTLEKEEEKLVTLEEINLIVSLIGAGLLILGSVLPFSVLLYVGLGIFVGPILAMGLWAL